MGGLERDERGSRPAPGGSSISSPSGAGSAGARRRYYLYVTAARDPGHPPPTAFGSIDEIHTNNPGRSPGGAGGPGRGRTQPDPPGWLRVELQQFEGDTYCSVTLGSGDTIKGVGPIEAAHGGTSDIGEPNNSIVAAALGTLCNRIFGSGNTTADLSGLS